MNSEVLQMLRGMVGKDTLIILDVIDSYLEGSLQCLQVLNCFLCQSSGVVAYSSTLKAISTTLGTTKLDQLCQDLEKSRDGTTIATPYGCPARSYA